jgi:hypothetical protein
MLLDANLLIYAFDDASPFHEPTKAWIEEQLNGTTRVGFPWESLTAFVRVSTHPRASATPITPDAAWTQVEEWLAADLSWVPRPTEHHGEVLGSLIRRYQLRGNVISDAHLAALALEHGLTLCSADTDFARFTEITWENPLAAPA